MKKSGKKTASKKRAAEWNAESLPVKEACSLCEEKAKSLKQPTALQLLHVFLDFYREQRICDVDDDEGDILMLEQENESSVLLTRQIMFDAQDSLIYQFRLVISLQKKVKEAAAEGGCDSLDELPEFEKLVLNVVKNNSLKSWKIELACLNGPMNDQ